MMPMISEQRVHTPADIDEALRFLSDHRGEDWRPLAGGTDVMVGLYRDRIGGNRWLNLSRLRPQLAGVHHEDNRLRIGALTTMAELRNSPLLDAVCPLIRQAAAAVGAAQIQNRATVGGNIVNSSPAGDTLPVWLALDAEVDLLSTRGCRRMRYDQFMTGYRRTVLAPDELLSAVLIPARPAAVSWMYFRKVAPRTAQGISKLVLAAVAALQDGRYRNVRLAFGSLGPHTLRARAAEQQAEGELPSLELGERAAELLSHDLTPIDDHRSTADYRLLVAKNLVRTFLAGHVGDLHPQTPRSGVAR